MCKNFLLYPHRTLRLQALGLDSMSIGSGSCCAEKEYVRAKDDGGTRRCSYTPLSLLDRASSNDLFPNSEMEGAS